MSLTTHYTFDLVALSGHTGYDHLLPEVIGAADQRYYSTAGAARRGGWRAAARAIAARYPGKALLCGLDVVVRRQWVRM